MASTPIPPGPVHRPREDFLVGDSVTEAEQAQQRSRLRRIASRTTFFRMLGLALLIYGAVGLAAMFYAHGLVRDAFVSLRGIGSVADEKSRALRSLQSISATLGDASSTSSNLRSSFQESQTSINTASSVSSEVAVAFRQVAQAASLQLFGIQPLIAIAQPFRDSSDRLDQLSQDLTRTGTTIGHNATDAQRLSGDFSRLKADVDDLGRIVSSLPSNPISNEGAQRLETALNAMLVWIGLQGLAALFAGLALVLYPLRQRA